MRNIILTGATGILGLAIIEQCVNNGINVTAVVRPNSPKNSKIQTGKHVKIIECGLDNISNLPELLHDKYDSFFHLGWADTDKAGRDDALKQACNIDYTLQAVYAAKKIGCTLFLGAGSQAEYGRVLGPISSDMKVAPETAYGTAKYAAGKLSSKLCTKLGIKHVWTRIFSVYGPNDSQGTMIMYCIDKLLKNEKPELTACGQMWDFLFCKDAARAILIAGEKGNNNGVYNIGSGFARPLKEYVEILRDSINQSLPLGIGSLEYAANQVMHLCADISNLTADTGFKPEVMFEQGILETIKWHKENR